MEFEFVEFYPLHTKKGKKIGTLHIYVIDCQLDIRGISVVKSGKSLYFYFPYFSAIDHETGNLVRYPVVRFTSKETQDEMIGFLQNTVKEIILKRIQ